MVYFYCTSKTENRKSISFIDAENFRCPNPFRYDSSKPHVLLDRKGKFNIQINGVVFSSFIFLYQTTSKYLNKINKIQRDG